MPVEHSPINLPQLWSRPWWQAAEALMLLGYEVLVLDPTMGAGDSLWDGDSNHGTVRIVDYPTSGWQVSCHEFSAPWTNEPTPVPEPEPTPVPTTYPPEKP